MFIQPMKIKCTSQEENVAIQRHLHELYQVRWGVMLGVNTIWSDIARWEYLIISQNENPEATYFGYFFFNWGNKGDFDSCPFIEVTPEQIFEMKTHEEYLQTK